MVKLWTEQRNSTMMLKDFTNHDTNLKTIIYEIIQFYKLLKAIVDYRKNNVWKNVS